MVGAAARIAVSPELRVAYRALGRAPVAPPLRARLGMVDRADEVAGDGPGATAHLLGERLDEVAEPSLAARPAMPDGGFPIRLRCHGASATGDVVETAVLLAYPVLPGHGAAWSLEVLVDATGGVFARITRSLGPQGRSGTGEVSAPLAVGADLQVFVRGVMSGGPSALTVSGPDIDPFPSLDCLTADGRLAPRPIRRKDIT